MVQAANLAGSRARRRIVVMIVGACSCLSASSTCLTQDERLVVDSDSWSLRCLVL